jgi:cell division protein FtsI (penicillin-binding protein 3)
MHGTRVVATRSSSRALRWKRKSHDARNRRLASNEHSNTSWSRPPAGAEQRAVGSRDLPTSRQSNRTNSASVRNTNAAAGRRPTRHYRFLSIGWILLFGFMFSRMIQLQVTDRSSLVAKSEKQRIRRIVLNPERGDLVDRYGVPLAISVLEWRLFGDPKQLTESPKVVAEKIAPVLGFDPGYLEQRLSRKGRYVVLAKGLDEEKSKAIRALKISGIGLEDEQNRVYPAGDLARSVLGRVNRAEGKGETGLESRLEGSLRGEPGELLVERTARGQQIPSGMHQLNLAKRGTTCKLTIDSALQYAVDGMTAQSVATTGSKGGIVAVASIDGEVLALSNMKTNSNGEVVPTEHNAGLVAVYEPGSVMKVVTIAAALEEGVTTVDKKINVPDHLQVSDHKFKDDDPHKEVMWTPGEILTASSNIGTIKIAKTLGKKQVDSYIRGFGLGQKTGIDFPGESAGILPKLDQWTGTSIGTVPIGQGIAVTALQMLGVYTTLANKGVRMPLRLVNGTIDPDGIARDAKVEKGVRVVSESVANELTTMLESVVANGTGKKAAVPGYRIAGKTGTAQKPNETSRGYKPDAYVASFAGYFPAENPRFAIITILDEPTKTSYYGGAIAAPLFAEVAHFTAQHYRVKPSSGRDVTFSTPTATAADSIVDNSREMRAVKEAGTWQQAVIRKAALRNLESETPADSAPRNPSSKTSVVTTDETVGGEKTAKAEQGGRSSAKPETKSQSKSELKPTPSASSSERKKNAQRNTQRNTQRADEAETTQPVAQLPNPDVVAEVPASAANIPDLSRWKTKPRVLPGQATAPKAKAQSTKATQSTQATAASESSAENAATVSVAEPTPAAQAVEVDRTSAAAATQTEVE